MWPPPNGTSVLDVTDPKQPKYLAHIPGEIKDAEGEDGGAQMVRVCSGNDLPRGQRNSFYLLRAFGKRCKIAIQTNNVEVDNRGYIYAADRANTACTFLSARMMRNASVT